MSEDGGTTQLVDGAYAVALHSAASGLGPSTHFTVAGEGLSVEVGDWQPFDVTFELRDGYTGQPIPQGRARFEDTTGIEAWEATRMHVATADEFGMVRFEGVQPGEWRLFADADGYGENAHIYQLPGAWTLEGDRPKVVNLQWFPIPPITRLAVQLVGESEWPSLTEFKLSHTHEGEKISFDQSGLAALELGWFDEPLYLKLWYPDGRAAISYLEEGLPENGTPHPIEIGGERRLEVDLRFGPKVAEELQSFDSAAIRVSFKPATGDAMFVGKETYDEGVFVFGSVQADEAIVNFATSKPGGGAVDWVTKLIELKETGTTTCSLLVDQRPMTLTFIDADSQPVPGYNFEVRQLPNTTSWVGGGTADDTGSAEMARILERPAVMIGWVGDPVRFQAYDLPIDFPTQGQSFEISVGDSVATFVDVTVEGRGREGASLQLRTRETDLWMDNATTDDNGQTSPIDLVRGSQLNATLISEELWTRSRTLELEPGRNVLACFDTGEMVIQSKAQAGRVRVDRTGETLESWLAEGLVAWRTLESGSNSLRLPTGSYTIDAGLPTEKTLLLLRDATAQSGL